MPQELRPVNKRKTAPSTSAKPNLKSKKTKTTEEIENKLKMLEEKETHDRVNDETDKKAVGSDSEEEQEEDEKMEQELEDDLDYGDNYFDNGEDYIVEEDDDGPTY